MNKVPDRAKMRREYLWKKGAAHFLLVGAEIIAVCGIVATILIAVAAIFLMAAGGSHLFDGGTTLGVGEIVAGATPFFITAIAVTAAFCFVSKATKKKIDALPYVPPVRQQIATLPAEEVLLRGSQSLPTSTEELLRPAGSEDTKREELLRASVGNES